MCEFPGNCLCVGWIEIPWKFTRDAKKDDNNNNNNNSNNMMMKNIKGKKSDDNNNNNDGRLPPITDKTKTTI